MSARGRAFTAIVIACCLLPAPRAGAADTAIHGADLGAVYDLCRCQLDFVPSHWVPLGLGLISELAPEAPSERRTRAP